MTETRTHLRPARPTPSFWVGLDSPEADQIRTILTRNVADRSSPFTA